MTVKSTKEQVLKTLTKLIITLLLALGILFLGYIFEETFHIIDSEGHAMSVCLDLNTKINDDIQNGFLVMHTEINRTGWKNVSEYKDWRQQTEKTTDLLLPLFTISLAIITGYLLRKITVK